MPGQAGAPLKRGADQGSRLTLRQRQPTIRALSHAQSGVASRGPAAPVRTSGRFTHRGGVMRLKDVNAAELTEPVGSAPGGPEGSPAYDAATTPLAPVPAAVLDEPLLLTQEVPLELLASEFEPRDEIGAPPVPPAG